MTTKFRPCYIAASPCLRNFMTHDRRVAASYTRTNCTISHIQDDVPPRDVTEDLTAEQAIADAAILARAGIKPREYDDEPDLIQRRRYHSNYDEHALGWENV